MSLNGFAGENMNIIDVGVLGENMLENCGHDYTRTLREFCG